MRFQKNQKQLPYNPFLDRDARPLLCHLSPQVERRLKWTLEFPDMQHAAPRNVESPPRILDGFCVRLMLNPVQVGVPHS